MPGKFYGFTVPHDEARPLEQRGFVEVKPTDAYANLNPSQQRNVDISPDGNDPWQSFAYHKANEAEGAQKDDNKVTR